MDLSHVICQVSVCRRKKYGLEELKYSSSKNRSGAGFTNQVQLGPFEIYGYTKPNIGDNE